MSRFKKIEPVKVRLADEVYQQIFDAITRGDIAPGERIVQEKLGQELQVSRTPVREALLRLEQEGVLTIVGRSGFEIRQLTDSEVRDIYQSREAIEGYSMRLLTEAADGAVVKRIETVISKEENLKSRTVRSYFNANRNIHRAIVEATGNVYLLEMFDGMWNRSLSFQMFAEIGNIDLAKSLGEHMQLCEAIRTGDANHAVASMREHISSGLDLQLEGIAAKRKGAADKP
jgi:DNA-binding GntR family transcriptional regulator